MFEIFDSVGEITFVFKGTNLIYANNAACFYLRSYEKSLLKREIGELFEDDSLSELNKMSEESRNFKLSLTFRNGKSEKFKIKFLSEYDEEFVLVQSEKEVKPAPEQEYNRIIAPRMIYDPVKAGKFHIMNYEISDSFMKVQEELKELSNIPSARKSIQKISDVLKDILEEIKRFTDDLIDVDQRYGMVNNVFSVNELLWKITKRMNSVFKIENTDAEVICDTKESPDIAVLGDYMKIGSAIVTLITLLINIQVKRNKKAKATMRLNKEGKFCVIDIVSKDVTINQKTYEEIINPKTEIINLNRYMVNKLTLNIHIASSYIELNNGELSVKRNKKEGTVMSVRLPVVQKKYFFGEQIGNISDEYIDNIISKIVLRIINNV